MGRAHGDVAVQSGAILDRQACHLDVAVDAAPAGQGELALGGDIAVYGAPYRDVLTLERGVHGGAVVDVHIAADLDLTFELAGHPEVAVVGELSDQAVSRAEADAAAPMAVLSPVAPPCSCFLRLALGRHAVTPWLLPMTALGGQDSHVNRKEGPWLPAETLTYRRT